jgi:hypothetical protein
VIYITFGGFALLDYFVSCLKHLPAPESGGSLPSSTHNPPTFTLKTRLKPTRRDAGARFERKWNQEQQSWCGAQQVPFAADRRPAAARQPLFWYLFGPFRGRWHRYGDHKPLRKARTPRPLPRKTSTGSSLSDRKMFLTVAGERRLDAAWRLDRH